VVAVAVSDARAAVLGGIRAALTDVPADEPPALAPAAAPASVADPLALFLARLVDYGAEAVAVGDEAELPAAIDAALARHGIANVVAPADLSASWLVRPAHRDDPPLTREAIAAADGVVTACALAIAETGTIVLDHGIAQGRRALTLLPDLHVCVVREEQLLASVPEAIDALAQSPGPITLISGPSATSDIELVRVEGVHGPRRMHVLVVHASPSKNAVVAGKGERDHASVIPGGE
jgi:L-lactate dehydrogenase complex protein LldG